MIFVVSGLTATMRLGGSMMRERVLRQSLSSFTIPEANQPRLSRRFHSPPLLPEAGTGRKRAAVPRAPASRAVVRLRYEPPSSILLLSS
jgi:hypothetical protein